MSERKKGIAEFELGENTYKVRLNYSAYEDLEALFGKSLAKHFSDCGEDLPLGDIPKILQVMLKYGGEEVKLETLKDEMDMCNTDYYIRIIVEGMGLTLPAEDKDSDKAVPLDQVEDLPPKE